METETAIKPELNPYGAWYTQPGGLLFDRDDRDDAAALARLKRLREDARNEPPYSHRKVVITYSIIGMIHLPFAFFNIGLKSTIKDLDAADWFGFVLALAIVAIFAALAVRNALRPPQRTAHSMFKGYLAAAIGLSRGRAHSMLLNHDRDERLRTPPPPLVEEGTNDEPLPFSEQNKFERYWLNAFGGGWHPWKTISLNNVQSVELAPDLVLMQSDVKVTMRSLVAQFLAFIPVIIGTALSTIALFIFVAVAFASDPDRETVLFWIIPVAAPLALGMLVAIAMFIRSMVPIRRTTFPIRKLLVRVNGQWRVFNGELQGADETDVTWVLETAELHL